MAKKLVIKYKDNNGDDVTFNYNYIKADPATAYIKSLATGLITNGSIFVKPPVTAVSATIVTTSEEAIDLSD